MNQNHTPLPEHLLSKPAPPVGISHKEAEPLRVESHPIKDISESTVEEQVEAQPSQDVAGQVTVVPEKPELTKEEEDLGVTASPASIFVQGKKIDLPLSASEFETDMQKPYTTGARWIAEIVRYLLQKFHVTVKKISGVFQFVNQ